MQNERRDHVYNFTHIMGGFNLIFIDWYFNELHEVSPLMFMTYVCSCKLHFWELKCLNISNTLKATKVEKKRNASSLDQLA